MRTYLDNRGANVIDEPHDCACAMFDGDQAAEASSIGSAQVSRDDFVAPWQRLAAELGESTTSPVWLGMTNEPNAIGVQTWVDVAQAAPSAIHACATQRC